MPDYEKLTSLALECGFTNAGPLDPSTLVFMDEVRDMCAADKCQMYDKSWACPPACGTLEEMRKKVEGYKHGLIVQTVGEMEDSLDWEAIQDTAAKQGENFMKLEAELEKLFPKLVAMGTGTCTRCTKCTYPDAPCRFPEKLFTSMEGCGLLVSKVCTDNGMPYNYGPNRIAYTGCFLFN